MKAMRNYLRSVGKNAVRNAKNTLRTKGIKDSAIEESITYRLNVKDKAWTLEFRMSSYGKFLNDGVAGNNGKNLKYTDMDGKNKNTQYRYSDKAPPVKVFEEWIKRKGIKGRDKKGRFIKRKSLAFAMAKSRQIKGYQGLSFFTKPLSIALKKFPKELLNSIEKDFYTAVENLDIKNLKK